MKNASEIPLPNVFNETIFHYNRSMEHKEIERKFLLPPCNIEKFLQKHEIDYSFVEIEQFYIDRSDRYRRMGERYYHTIKRGNGLVREEFEEEIDKKLYECKKMEAKKPPIKKIRYQFRLDGRDFVADRFKRELKGLNLLEVEFESEGEALAFQLPPLLAKIVIAEVTDNPSFTNAALHATRVIPAIEEELHTILQRVVRKDNFLKAKGSVDISAYESAAHGLKGVIFALIHSAYANAKAIRSGDEDPERLHQLRVSMRKIRALFSKFAPLFDEEWLKEHKEKLAASMKKTNAMRDLDVYLLKIDRYKEMVDPRYHEGLEYLRSYLLVKGQVQRVKLAKFLESKRWREEVATLYRFSKCENIQGLRQKAHEPIIIPLKKILKKSFTSILRQGKKLKPIAQDSEFHSLRIKVKKLRYSLEFFSPIFDQESYEKILTSLKRVQTILGDHQDLVVQRAFINSLLKEPQFQEKEMQKALRSLEKALKKEQKESKKRFRKTFGKFKKRFELFEKMICHF